MKTLLLFAGGLFTFHFLFAQAPSIQWQKSLGGSGWDWATSIQQTSDGGYIVAGSSESANGDVTGNHGDSDYWIVKLDADGSIQWQKSLGGSSKEEAHSIQQTSDGGYIVAGSSRSNDGDVTGNHGYDDCWIVKLDTDGTIQWQKSMGGSNDDIAQSIQQTSDGGYIVAGYTYSNDGDVAGNKGNNDYWIVKLDTDGSIQWQKSLGGGSTDLAYSIQQTTDGSYIVAGSSESTDGNVTGNHGDFDYWIVKLSSSSAIQWQKSLGGSVDDSARSIQQTTDGGYIVAGFSKSNAGNVSGNHGDYDYWVVKLSSGGAIQWRKSLGGSGEDRAHSIQQTMDGGYIVAGFSMSSDGDVTENQGDNDYWIVKLDTDGSIQWQKSLGGSGEDRAYSVQQTSDGGYIVAGYSGSSNGDVTGIHGGSDYWIVKLCPPISTTNNVAICSGESITVGTNTYSETGTYTDELFTSGCGTTTITTVLTVKQTSSTTLTETACGSYTLNGQTYTTDGTHTQVIPNTAGCDSTITLNLTIKQPSSVTLTETACGSYTLNGQTYTTSGTHTQVIPNAAGCDSTITLNLTIKQPSSYTLTETTCDSYTLNGQTYTTSGTHVQVIPNAAGCDSTITLNLTVGNSTLNTGLYINGSQLIAAEENASYQWIDCSNNNVMIYNATDMTFTPTSSGSYAVILTSTICPEVTAQSNCINVNITGISDLEESFAKIYPNPTSGKVLIEGKTILKSITVKDASGKIVLTQRVNANIATVSLEKFSSGVYLIELSDTRNRKQITKVIKE